jgi:hypothetical protein
MAATMLGQGKNAWQAEIDAAAEVCCCNLRICMRARRADELRSAGRFPPIRSEVRRGVVPAAAG